MVEFSISHQGSDIPVYGAVCAPLRTCACATQRARPDLVARQRVFGSPLPRLSGLPARPGAEGLRRPAVMSKARQAEEAVWAGGRDVGGPSIPATSHPP